MNIFYIRYSPSEVSAISTSDSQIYIKIPRKCSVIFLLNSHLELNFDVLQAASGNRHADVLRLVNLAPIVLFSNYKITNTSGNHLENIDHVHIVSLMYNLSISVKIAMIYLLVSTVVVIEEDENELIMKISKVNIILDFI